MYNTDILQYYHLGVTMVKALAYRIVIREFKLQSGYYIHFQAYIL